MSGITNIHDEINLINDTERQLNKMFLASKEEEIKGATAFYFFLLKLTSFVKLLILRYETLLSRKYSTYLRAGVISSIKQRRERLGDLRAVLCNNQNTRLPRIVLQNFISEKLFQLKDAILPNVNETEINENFALISVKKENNQAFALQTFRPIGILSPVTAIIPNFFFSLPQEMQNDIDELLRRNNQSITEFLEQSERKKRKMLLRLSLIITFFLIALALFVFGFVVGGPLGIGIAVLGNVVVGFLAILCLNATQDSAETNMNDNALPASTMWRMRI